MLVHLATHKRRIAVLALVTLVAVLIEVAQHESAGKICSRPGCPPSS